MEDEKEKGEWLMIKIIQNCIDFSSLIIDISCCILFNFDGGCENFIIN